MENEVVSKNFIEQEIEKDLRTCKIYFAELWIGTEI